MSATSLSSILAAPAGNLRIGVPSVAVMSALRSANWQGPGEGDHDLRPHVLPTGRSNLAAHVPVVNPVEPQNRPGSCSDSSHGSQREGQSGRSRIFSRKAYIAASMRE
jgi:hypothetical protein